jgi:nucleotide-binding universal stress UspA family protein
MSKRILVPLDSSPFSEAATEFACFLARMHSAAVGGLVVLDMPGIERSVGAVPLGGLHYAEMHIASEEKRQETQIRGILQKFKAKCSALGVTHFESERQGSPSENILKESRFYDCVVVGIRTYFNYGTNAGADQIYGTRDDRSGKSLDDFLDHSAVPLFAVPAQWKLPTRGLQCLIAFDGSIPSVRALHYFARLVAPQLVKPTLLTSSEKRSDGQFLLDQAAQFLSAHGFVEMEKQWTAVPIRQAVTEGCFDSADLLVLGAHSHSGLLNFMAGNVCRDWIERGSKLLLIAT